MDLYIIKTISPYFVLIPFIFGLLKLKSLSREQKILFSAISLGVLGEISMKLAIALWQNNMPVMHIYTLLEFVLLLSVFHLGKPNLITRNVYISFLILFTFIWFVDILFLGGIWKGIALMRSLQGIILISIALLYFYRLLQELDLLRPERTFLFWFSIAILVYFGGNLLLFIYFNHITNVGMQSSEAADKMMQLKFITYFLNILLYILYSISFLWKESKNTQKSSLSAP